MMKRTTSYILIAAMLCGLCVTSGTSDAAAKLKLAKKSVTVTVKESVKVKYTSARKPKVTSKNKKIATAKVKAKNKKIVITGVKKGKTKIVVKASGKTAYIKVTVKKNNTGTVTSDPTLTATAKPTIDPAVKEAIKSAGSYAESVNYFSCKTFTKLKKDDGNTFASPFSLYMALAMLTNGAENNTKTELLNALGISDFNDWNNKAKALLNGSADDSVILNIANAAWIGRIDIPSENIDRDFILPIKTYYNGEVKKNVDMASQEFVNEVNHWADEKTNGMIKEILDRPPGADTAFVLANAVYFLGKWCAPFDTKSTYEKEFKGVKGNKKVSMMSKHSTSAKYFKDDRFAGVELGYGDGTYVMDVLLSADESKTTGAVWNALSADEQLKEIENFKTAGSKEIATLEIPKFEMESSFEDELIATMKNLGINDAFDADRADFGKIGKRIVVDKIKQKAKVKVSEEGTEAAAVTVIVGKNATAVRPTENKIEFIADRPFIFIIRDTLSGMILFIGEVNDL